MATWTVKITKDYFNKIKQLYNNNNCKLPNKNLILFKKNSDLTISIFKNMTLLLQGNELSILDFRKKIFDYHRKNNNVLITKKIDGYIGMDEVGTGDYYGPIITCACYLPNTNISKVKLLKVKDSKKIQDDFIIFLSNKIKEYVDFYVSICMPKQYNGLIDKFHNANVVKAIYHNETIKNLKKEMNKSTKYLVVLDQFVNSKKYYEYLKRAKKIPIKIDIMQTKAESKYLSVACASIIARSIFLQKMNELSRQINILLPKGASNLQRIIKIGQIISRKAKINEYAKLNFESITNKIMN